MEPDMDVSFDPYWQTPDLIFEDPPELDLGGVSSMYAPAADGGSLSGYDDSSSPDGASSSCLTADAAHRPSPPAAKTKNVGMERDRRKRLNDKLFALRGVVPNITKMDKASVIQDAIAYIEQLQEEERRMLAEVHALESAVGAATVKAENLSSTGESAVAAEEETVGGVVASPERKKMSRSAASIDDAHPVEILEVIYLGTGIRPVGEKTAAINYDAFVHAAAGVGDRGEDGGDTLEVLQDEGRHGQRVYGSRDAATQSHDGQRHHRGRRHRRPHHLRAVPERKNGWCSEDEGGGTSYN